MRTILGLGVRAAGLAIVLFGASRAYGQTATSTADRGRSLFVEQCAPCHGREGQGRGDFAYLVYPRPRDFTQGSFKFRSTRSGEVPTDEDLLRTITNGIPGTSMPSWASLPEADRRLLVGVVKSFAPRRFRGTPRPLAIPDPPENLASLAGTGHAIYDRMGCPQCHGTGGRGDGPASPTLRDDRGLPIRPYDFTRGGRMRGGSSPRDVYRTFLTGLDGTPMPSFETSIAEAERWPLVAYVLSLAAPASGSGSGEPAPPEGTLLCARADRVPLDPADGAWQRAQAVTVRLRPLWGRESFAERATVQALADGRTIGFRIEWPDHRADDRNFHPEQFRDAVAIEFPIAPMRPGWNASDLPFHGMCSRGRPCNLWHWKADWQADMGRQGVRDLEASDPTNAIEQYPFDARERGVFYTGRAAGNPLSAAVRRSAAEELVATGPGTLTSQPVSSQEVEANGVWRDGRWTVVLRRPIAAHDAALDVDFRDATRLPFALAIFDGEFADRNGQKAVSGWNELRLPAAVAAAPRRTPLPASAAAGVLVVLAAVLGAARRRRGVPRTKRPEA